MKFKVFLLLLVLLPFLLSISRAASSKKNFFSQEEWMGVYSGNDKIGYSHTVIKPKEGLEVFEENKLKMTVLGTNQDVETKSSYVLDGYSL
jgi:hypothetical protein